SVTTGAGPTGNWEIRVSTVTTPQFTEYFSIYFNGDSNYAQSNASSSSVSVAIPDFTLSPASGLTLQPVAGQAASAQITITPATSTASTVNLSAITPGPAVSGYAFTIIPQQVSLTGAPVTATISFIPTNSNSSTASAIRHQSAYQSHVPSDSIPLGQRGAWWTLSAVSGLACCFTLLISSGRKRFYYFAGALGPIFLLAL